MLNVQILKDGFFFSVLDYTYIEENYTMTATVIPPLLDMDDDQTTWISAMSRTLLLMCVIGPLFLMLCMNIKMGRVWSLYFMLQIVSNIRNFTELRIPANVSHVLQLLDQISNFRITTVKSFSHFFGANRTFVQKEMIIAIVVYFTILALVWGMELNWRKTKYIKRKLMWSGILRSIMMTWFATALYAFTWFHAVNDGYHNDDKIHGESAKSRLTNRRKLQEVHEVELNGLAKNQLTREEVNGNAFMPLLKVFIIVGFPIFSYLLI
jgi:hypothetical protein